MRKITWLLLIACLLNFTFSFAQPRGNDVNTPLHLMKPDYAVPYGIPTSESVKQMLDRVFKYLDETTPAQFVNRRTGAIVDLANVDTSTILKQGDFRLNSYEWGVTYQGMLQVGEATGDAAYTNYAKSRMNFIADAIPVFKSRMQANQRGANPFRGIIDPRALDDAGAMCAAMIKTLRAGGSNNLRPLIDNFIGYISTKEFRFADGTLARNRPQKNTLWLDDLYMSIPALAQAGKLTGDRGYYDDAVKQVLQFSQRMFNKDMGLYMHGWVQGMDPHPEFHWARANGWAVLAMAELLDVLPENHPGRKAVLDQYKAHVKGLSYHQSGMGLWHQLLEKNDSYLETSATAIYTYAIARGINKGWLDAMSYAPLCFLAWNGITTKINAKGQVEGTCVGTGMAFDPAFYYYRPVNVYAAHGYGPVLLAGSEIINLLKNKNFEINDSSVQLKL